ncbi:hypothetical protein GALMADRAFT_61085, partial [Galerina marginata CBS 339.88]
VIVTLLHIVAISLTLFRLHYRKRTRRLWWDDYTAGFATFMDFGYLPMLWLSYTPPGSVLNSHKFTIVKYWVSFILFLVVVWCTRVSIALALARVFPPGENTRRFAIGLAIFFASLYIAVTARFVVVCSKQMAEPGRSTDIPCNWSTDFRFLHTIGNLFSDTLLVATPLYKLWRVRLPRSQRRLILAGFAASALTTIPSIACSVFLFAPTNWGPGTQYLRIVLGHFVAGISLTACNLLVVITYIYNVLRAREDQEPTISTPPETTERTHNTEPISHSNQVPSESALSTMVLTQITDAYVFTQSSNIHVADSSRSSQSTNHSSYSSSDSS